MNATQEQWLPIVGYEGLYEVSDQGRVRSLDRTVVARNGLPRRLRGAMLKPIRNVGTGYFHIKLPNRDPSGPPRRWYEVHHLVLEAFVAPRVKGMVACHADGDRTNNAARNLRWGTYTDNVHDSVRHGTNREAKKTACPKGHRYTEENVYTRPGTNGRACRTCRRDDNRERERQRRAAARRSGH